MRSRAASVLSYALVLCVLTPALCKGPRPRPVPATGGIESVLEDIGTDASKATLRAMKDAKLLAPSTVGSFLKSAAAAVAATGKDARPWKAATIYRHLLVHYLRYTRQKEVLALLRRWASSGDLPEQQQAALQQLVAQLDIAAFVQWAKGTAKDRHKHAHDHSQSRRAKGDAAARQNNVPTPTSETSPPLVTSETSPTLAAAAAPKPQPLGAQPPAARDPKDPLYQLAEWGGRVKALGGKLDFWVKEQGPAKNVSAKNRRFLNVGVAGFKARRIGVVFHVFQFTDSKGFLYPPQAYRNGSLPARNILDPVNRLYRYSGTNIQFYLKEYRVDTKKYPYLLQKNGFAYQSCAATGEACLCPTASRFNADPRKYINIYIIGSSSYQPLVSDPAAPTVNSMAFTAAIPLHADGCAFLYNKLYSAGNDGPWDPRGLKSQYVWLNWDRLDPSADNSPAAFNQGASSLGHELGHLMGLLHTFQGSCSSPSNDAVSDTPVDSEYTDEEVPNSLCKQVTLQGRLPSFAQVKKFDSCQGDRYVDNIFNLMSYSPALCRLHLTRGQVKRMQILTNKFYKF